MKALPSSFSLLWGKLEIATFSPKFHAFPTSIVCSTLQNTVSCNVDSSTVLTSLAAFYVHGTWGLAIQTLEEHLLGTTRTVQLWKGKGWQPKVAAGSWWRCFCDANSTASGRVERQTERNEGTSHTKSVSIHRKRSIVSTNVISASSQH